jgi:hypothetical protein
VQSTNASKLTEFIYGWWSYPKIKLADWIVWVDIGKYSWWNTMADITTYTNEPFFSNIGVITNIGTVNAKFYLYAFWGTNYLRYLDLTTWILDSSNTPNTKWLSKIIVSREDPTKLFFYTYDSIWGKVWIYTIESWASIVSDIQPATVDPAPADWSDVIVINWLQYILTSAGLLSMIATWPWLTTLPLN